MCHENLFENGISLSIADWYADVKSAEENA